MENRNYTSSVEHRFGYQNQEEDPEFWGGAVQYEYRVEDDRSIRFFSLDPLARKYAYNSPYAFSENRLIDGVELEGLESFKLIYVDYTATVTDGIIDKSTVDELSKRGLIENGLVHHVGGYPQEGLPTVGVECTECGHQYWVVDVTDWEVFDPNLLVDNDLEELDFSGDLNEVEGSATTGGPAIINLRFQNHSAQLTSDSDIEADAADLLSYLTDNPTINVVLYGNTGADPGNPSGNPLGRGDDVRNINETYTDTDGNTISGTVGDLMEARADILGDYLIENGIDEERISTRPGERTDSPEGRNISVDYQTEE